ncbi:MAG: hypothetical protein QM675_12305, partial [Protaetiibacter sp.]
RTKAKSAIAGAAALALVGLSAAPATAATLDFGARNCSSGWVVETYTFSSGNTAHLQIGSATKTMTYSNGTNIIHRYYSAGLQYVTASSATTDGAFQSTGNGVTCTT